MNRQYAVTYIKKHDGESTTDEDALWLVTTEVEVGNIVYHFPDPMWGLTFEITSIQGEIAMLKYHTHPLNKFIGNEREYLTENLFKLVAPISSPPEWLRNGMGFDTDSVQITKLKTGGVELRFKCPTCKVLH